jgi:branched-subunit amino acid aminotransferase/4-amino-4-deoxychorismate lyase
MQLDVLEQDLTPGMINKAQEVFLTNSLIGIKSVCVKQDAIKF